MLEVPLFDVAGRGKKGLRASELLQHWWCAWLIAWRLWA